MGDEKLPFGELLLGDYFICFPVPGDNEGHGGYLGGHILFRKLEDPPKGPMVPVDSGAAVNGRGIVSHLPWRMPVLKVIVGKFGI